MSTSETILKNKVLRWLKTQNLWFYKVSDRYTSGIPDLFILKKGKVYMIELKSLTGVVTKIQQHTIDCINQHGGIATTCRSLDEVMEKLK